MARFLSLFVFLALCPLSAEEEDGFVGPLPTGLELLREPMPVEPQTSVDEFTLKYHDQDLTFAWVEPSTLSKVGKMGKATLKRKPSMATSAVAPKASNSFLSTGESSPRRQSKTFMIEALLLPSGLSLLRWQDLTGVDATREPHLHLSSFDWSHLEGTHRFRVKNFDFSYMLMTRFVQQLEPTLQEVLDRERVQAQARHLLRGDLAPCDSFIQLSARSVDKPEQTFLRHIHHLYYQHERRLRKASRVRAGVRAELRQRRQAAAEAPKSSPDVRLECWIDAEADAPTFTK